MASSTLHRLCTFSLPLQYNTLIQPLLTLSQSLLALSRPLLTPPRPILALSSNLLSLHGGLYYTLTASYKILRPMQALP
jgi:hypothetical protein